LSSSSSSSSSSPSPQFYEKHDVRRKTAETLLHLLRERPGHRERLALACDGAAGLALPGGGGGLAPVALAAGLADPAAAAAPAAGPARRWALESAELVPRFLNHALNDAIYQLDEALTKLPEVRAWEAAAPERDARREREAEEARRAAALRARGGPAAAAAAAAAVPGGPTGTPPGAPAAADAAHEAREERERADRAAADNRHIVRDALGRGQLLLRLLSAVAGLCRGPPGPDASSVARPSGALAFLVDADLCARTAHMLGEPGFSPPR